MSNKQPRNKQRESFRLVRTHLENKAAERMERERIACLPYGYIFQLSRLNIGAGAPRGERAISGSLPGLQRQPVKTEEIPRHLLK